jgi:hypothetical protein
MLIFSKQLCFSDQLLPCPSCGNLTDDITEHHCSTTAAEKRTRIAQITNPDAKVKADRHPYWRLLKNLREPKPYLFLED